MLPRNWGRTGFTFAYTVILLGAFALLLDPTVVAADGILLVVSEEWPGATNADGSGFYWALTRSVYREEGYAVQFQILPYPRATARVLSGAADLWLGAYPDEIPGALYPQTPFDADILSIAVRADRVPAEQRRSGEQQAATAALTAELLEDQAVAWQEGYELEQYLPVAVRPRPVPSREAGVAMVYRRRVAAVVDSRHELEIARAEMGFTDEQIVILPLYEIPLVPGFRNDERGLRLQEVWDRRMQALHESGALRRIYLEYGYTDFYPF